MGLYGKIPSRGDFVGAGLPVSFVRAWDAWMRRALVASRAVLGEQWLPAWLEAPVWRFALPGGACGPEAALGLWMPSVDRVGRHFPLVVGACAASLSKCPAGFLGAAELAGRAALERDLDPEAVLMRLADPVGEPEALPNFPAEGALWWTEGSPRCLKQSFVTEGLPDPVRFAAMLDGAAAAAVVS
ncbi:MAG: type VI secretion system-associated protein TagF [Acetobacteraceae bacterium]|nr:type VI secretion system-associated protein TagF [Acetobacteraceae bacterium]